MWSYGPPNLKIRDGRLAAIHANALLAQDAFIQQAGDREVEIPTFHACELDDLDKWQAWRWLKDRQEAIVVGHERRIDGHLKVPVHFEHTRIMLAQSCYQPS